MESGKFPKVSIIIPVYNAAKTLRLCLDSVINVDYPKDKLEIIVVDNASDDNSKRIIEEYPVTYGFETKKTSYAARNKGIAISKGEIIAFTDSDCIVDMNWVKGGVEAITLLNVDFVGGVVLAYQPKTVIENFLNYNGAISLDRSTKQQFYPTCNLFVRKSVIVDLEGFDDEFTSGGDLDFCWRSNARGYKGRMSDTAIVFHKHRIKILGLYEQYFKYGYGKYYLETKYNSIPHPGQKQMDISRKGFSHGPNLKSLTLTFCNALWGVVIEPWHRKLYGFCGMVVTMGIFTGKIYAIVNERKKLRITFLPDWTRTNPYQVLLYSNLARNGYICNGRSMLGFMWILKTSLCSSVIHLHWEHGLCNFNKGKLRAVFNIVKVLLSIILAKLLGHRLVYTIHNYAFHEPRHFKLEKYLRKSLLKLTDQIVVHSNAGKEFLVTEFNVKEKKVNVIPHGSYLGYYPNEVATGEARKRLEIHHDAMVFLFIGMIRPYKGVLELIDSFRNLRSSDVMLIVAGRSLEDSFKDEVVERAGGDHRIRLSLEHIPDEEIQYYMNASNIVVLPYKKVLSSGSVLLALSFGRYVVAPKSGDIPSVVNENAGFLYDSDSGLSTDVLKESIKRYKSDYDEKEAIKIAQDLKWENIIGAYRTVYEQ